MSTIEIVSGCLLILASLCIIIVTLFQETSQKGLNSAVGGGNNDSFFDKNTSRTREAMLIKVTTVMSVIFFVATLAVNLIAVFVK